MERSGWLQYGVIVAAAYSAISLLILLRRTARTSHKKSYAPPAGSEGGGIWYAFTSGMSPTAKESVRNHIPTFIGGALFHLAIFGAAGHLLLALLRVDPLEPILWAIRIALFVGLVSGMALLIKRIAFRKMRIISTSDDYVANILVDLFLLMSLLASFDTAWLAALFIVTIVLLIYLPVGKIRHCVFFFYTRILFGRLFGRRGAFSHSAPGEK